MQIKLMKCSQCGRLALAVGNERISESSCSAWDEIRTFEVDEAQLLRLLTKRAPDRLADGGRKHPAKAVKQIQKLLAQHGSR